MKQAHSMTAAMQVFMQNMIESINAKTKLNMFIYGKSINVHPDLDIEPPKGKVSIAVTAIAAIAKYVDRDPEAIIKAVEIHDRVIRDAVREFGGYEVTRDGDSFVVAFASPLKALQYV